MSFTPFDLAPGVHLGASHLPIIAGPCVIEEEEPTFALAELLVEIANDLDLAVVFKASFDKANRSSIDSYRGPGLKEGLAVLDRIRQQTGLPILTDVHEASQCAQAAEVCDVLQIPAFLCRQTDLLLAAGATGRSINIKKGQFMAPNDMRKAVDKVRRGGGSRITVTERGSSFGYHNLVVDMRSFAMMQADGIPVIFDVTHSLQLPGADGDITGGDRRFAEPLARAAVAAGADGIFLEVHPNPNQALSDSTTQLPPERAKQLLRSLRDLHKALAGGMT